MRMLVLSDVHGNLPALEAVLAEAHDAVACLGDIVGYGPQPAECLALLRAEAAVAVSGNHDRAVAEGIAPRCSQRFEWLAEAVSAIARTALTSDDVAYLAALPHGATLETAGVAIALVHATPSDPLYGYRGSDARLWKRDVGSIGADVLLVGHTHIQFRLAVDEVAVINPGSVGQPKDGDARAAYAVVEDGSVTLRRVAYDVERTIRALERAPIGRAAVEVLAALLRTGRVHQGGDPHQGRPGR